LNIDDIDFDMMAAKRLTKNTESQGDAAKQLILGAIGNSLSHHGKVGQIRGNHQEIIV
jgi:hypothetical protein